MLGGAFACFSQVSLPNNVYSIAGILDLSSVFGKWSNILSLCSKYLNSDRTSPNF